MFVKPLRFFLRDKSSCMKAGALRSPLCTKQIDYLFGVAETGTEEMASLQRCGEALALSETLAGIVCAVRDNMC